MTMIILKNFEIFLFSFALFTSSFVNTFKLSDNDLAKLLDLYEIESDRRKNYDDYPFGESESLESVGDVDVTQESIKYIRKLTDSPKLTSTVGQVGGLGVEANGNLVIFHRASRRWSYDSFLPGDKFNTNKYDSIKEDCISHVNLETMQVVKSWGANTFYMPHGLTVDRDQNIWLTDVALHQVFKYDANSNFDKPSLVLGVRFENGNDAKHFCKPTDVAVASNGDIFVSDGYCNSRVVQFDKNGNYKKEFNLNGVDRIQIAHSVTLIENQNLVCVADRENGRIICFDIDTGKVSSVIEHDLMKRVFAIEYDQKEELLHAVSGSASSRDYPYGFTFDAARGQVFGDLLAVWEPTNYHFKDPHDLTVSPDGQKIFTGELDGSVEEFRLNTQSLTVNKPQKQLW